MGKMSILKADKGSISDSRQVKAYYTHRVHRYTCTIIIIIIINIIFIIIDTYNYGYY